MVVRQPSSLALTLYPHQKKTTFTSVWLDAKLIFQAVGLNGVKKALDHEAKIKARQPKEKMLYIWFIGVNPFYQQQGNGSLLLQQVVEEARSKGLPVYLETSALKNLQWYERYGFQIYDGLNFDYTLYFLKRFSS